MKAPTETLQTIFKENGCKKTIHLYSYVVVFCRRGGCDTMAVRYDGFPNKQDLQKTLNENEWKVKAIYKLHDEDFD